MKLAKTSISLILCVLLASCSATSNPNPVVDALQVLSFSANAAVIAAPILEATGQIDASQAAAIIAVARAAATQAQAAITEEESSDTNAMKLSAIIADMGMIPQSVPGLPPTAAVLIAAIVSSAQDIIRLLSQPSVTLAATEHPRVPVSLMLTRYDRGRLKKIRATNADTLARAK